MNLNFLLEAGKKLLLKNTKKMAWYKNVRIPYILCTLQNFYVFNSLKLFGAIFHLVVIHGYYMIFKFLQESVKKITSEKY